jgi:hypothetical protein
MADGQAGTFTVAQVVAGPRDWQSQKHGPQHSYELTLQGREANVEFSQSPGEPAPKDGDVIEGTIYPSGNSYPDKLYKKRKGGGGGGGRSPKEWAASGRAQGRAHAQEMALRWFTLKGTAPDGLGDLTAAIDWFFDDAQAALADGYRKDAGV